MNKEKKIIFEKIYNDLLDINNLVGDDKKHYDFLFINISNVTNEIDVLELLFDNLAINSRDQVTQSYVTNRPLSLTRIKEQLRGLSTK